MVIQTDVVIKNAGLIEEMLLRQLDGLVLSGRVDQRWLAIARTHLELGFMALLRAADPPVRLSDEEYAGLIDTIEFPWQTLRPNV